MLPKWLYNHPIYSYKSVKFIFWSTDLFVYQVCLKLGFFTLLSLQTTKNFEYMSKVGPKMVWSRSLLPKLSNIFPMFSYNSVKSISLPTDFIAFIISRVFFSSVYTSVTCGDIMALKWLYHKLFHTVILLILLKPVFAGLRFTMWGKAVEWFLI